MNTYKIFVSTDLKFFPLKDYWHKYFDVKAKNADEAIALTKKQYDNKYEVALISKM